MVGTPVTRKVYNAATTLFGIYWILMIVIVVAMIFNWNPIGGLAIIGSQLMIVIAFLMLVNGIKRKGR